MPVESAGVTGTVKGFEPPVSSGVIGSTIVNGEEGDNGDSVSGSGMLAGRGITMAGGGWIWSRVLRRIAGGRG